MTGKRSLVILAGLLIGVCLMHTPAPAYILERVSVASDGAQANSGCLYPASSAEGRYIAFASSASNLVVENTNGQQQIFVHDRLTGQTTCVSEATGAGVTANNYCHLPSISADGRYVAFTSYASNLAAGDTNGAFDIFVRDCQANQTARVSVASNGAQANQESDNASISADGRYVAFNSYATNLVSPDTNGRRDAFLHDRLTGQTVLLSIATDGTQGDKESAYPSLSGTGRYAAFGSTASNLVAGDTNAFWDAFVRDCRTGETSRVSVASDGTQGDNNSGKDGRVISADGRCVAFYSCASNLVPGPANNWCQLYLHDRLTSQTTRISVSGDGTQGDRYSADPSISADGRFVAFQSDATNLVSGDTNGYTDVFVHDVRTGRTARVSVKADGTQGNNDSGMPDISADGRFVAFASDATNLVPGDSNTRSDIFLAINPLAASSQSLPTAGWYLIGTPHEGDHPLADLEVAQPSSGRTLPLPDAVAVGWISPLLYYWDAGRLAYATCSCEGPPIEDDNALREGKGYWLATLVDGLTLIFP